MLDNSSEFGERRARSENGSRRHSKALAVRDVSSLAQARLHRIAEDYRAPRGRILDRAINDLWAALGYEQTEAQEADQGKVDLSWIMRPDERLTAADDPRIGELEERLAERRRARDAIMGRA